MNVLSRKLFHKCKILFEFCAFSQNNFCSSTSRQEFGRQFEEIVAESLRKFSFDVNVCGGPKDRGIDLKGIWRLKSSFVPIIGQCRRYKKRLGPKHVRELEGTLTHEAKGTLGIIVSESGFSKDAYGVFMCSLYPVALITLTGFSDDLLRWYSDDQSHETYVDKNQVSTSCEPLQQVQFKKAGKHLHGDIEFVDDLNRNVAGKHDKEVVLKRDGSHPTSSKNNLSYICTDLHQKDTSYDEENAVATAINGKSHTSGITYNRDSLKQLIHHNISEMGTGVFTMFELNPSAQKLLPNVVVGIKYTKHNFKAPELFIKEGGSLIANAT